MRDLDRLRLYLRDPAKAGAPLPQFSDEELTFIIDDTSAVEEAAALGWVLKAASAPDSPTSITVGQVSEVRAQSSEKFKVAMDMSAYWSGVHTKNSGASSSTGRLFSVNHGGMIGDLELFNAATDSYWGDLSRLS